MPSGITELPASLAIVEGQWDIGAMTMAWFPEGQLLFLDGACRHCSYANANPGAHISVAGEQNVLATTIGASSHFPISIFFQKQVAL